MVLAGIFLNVFYVIFRPLTVYPVYFLLNIFYKASVSGNIISANGVQIEIVNACIAGSAFFLLLILNFSTPKIRWKKRLLILIYDFAVLLIINIIRIFVLSILLANQSVFFYAVHLILWHAVSILLVFLIWILTLRIFKIKKIPFVSDLSSLCHTKKK
jgi:exosortase/archaeosortase family protein